MEAVNDSSQKESPLPFIFGFHVSCWGGVYEDLTAQQTKHGEKTWADF